MLSWLSYAFWIFQKKYLKEMFLGCVLKKLLSNIFVQNVLKMVVILSWIYIIYSWNKALMQVFFYNFDFFFLRSYSVENLSTRSTLWTNVDKAKEWSKEPCPYPDTSIHMHHSSLTVYFPKVMHHFHPSR